MIIYKVKFFDDVHYFTKKIDVERYKNEQIRRNFKKIHDFRFDRYFQIEEINVFEDITEFAPDFFVMG